MTEKTEIAVLGGGCFWCLEAVFSTLRGVRSVRSGYCGGQKGLPTYESVCGGTTGYAEVVEILFDPAIISFSTLLECFFAIHDPTSLNRQGHDVGTQYRSVIFCQEQSQAEAAAAMITLVNERGRYDGKVVTQVVTEKAPFYPAEKYHQGYYEANPQQGYCSIVIAPKLAQFRARYPELLRQEI